MTMTYQPSVPQEPRPVGSASGGGPTGTVDRADGAVLRWWRSGYGEPVVLVHGSFDDHYSLAGVAGMLDRHADVISYDRRGHGSSSEPRGQGSVHADADDVVAVVDNVVGGPVHLVGHGYGGTVALLAATKYGEAVRSVAVHEPPMFGLLAGNPFAKVLAAELSVWTDHAAELIASGDWSGGARVFAEKVAFGNGSWDRLLTREQRATMIGNAETWLDQYRDPDSDSVDITPLSWARFPVTVFFGERTHPLNRLVVDTLADKMPFLRAVPIAGAGHAPHLTHAAEFADAIIGHLRIGP